MNKKYIILAFTPSSLKNNYLWIKCKRYKLFDKKPSFLFGVRKGKHRSFISHAPLFTSLPTSLLANRAL